MHETRSGISGSGPQIRHLCRSGIKTGPALKNGHAEGSGSQDQQYRGNLLFPDPPECESAGLKSDAEYLAAHRELTADLIGRLIDRIEIDHEHHVTVSYSFTDTIAEVRKS